MCSGSESVGKTTRRSGKRGIVLEAFVNCQNQLLSRPSVKYKISAAFKIQSRRLLTAWLAQTFSVRSMLACILFVALSVPPQLVAQPLWFGSSDNPAEHVPLINWQRQSTIDLMGGWSLIGAQWRTAGNVSATVQSSIFTAHLSHTLRAGIYGSYRPDYDEAYDLFRVVEYVKVNTGNRARRYLRAGPSDRMRLGNGHLVNFFSNQTSWDERTPGIEGALFRRNVQVAAFTDNFLINGVNGGRLTIQPLAWLTTDRARSLSIGVSSAFDLKSGSGIGNRRLFGYNVDLSFEAAAIGDVLVIPFVSVAWFDGFGSGLAFGANIAATNLIDLARIDAKIALHYNGRDFIPGYFGSFYTINDGSRRILQTRDDIVTDEVVGSLLTDAAGGNDLETEFRVLFFDGFEFWYHFKRHYGTRRLSEYHLRLFFSSGRARIMLSQDRAGLRSFFTLFNDLGDLTALTFRTDYRLTESFWIFVRSRYSFEQLGELDDGTKTFLVQRRFEPLAGLRIAF